MKFMINSTALTESITAALTSLPSKPAAAILGGFLVEAAGDTVTLSSFNYDRATIRSCGADVGDPDSALVSGRLLAAVGSNLPKGVDATVTVQGAEMLIAAGRTTFRLPLMVLEDYPALPSLADGAAIGTVPCADFTDAVTVAGGFASTDQSVALENLTAINMAFQPGWVTLRATDRYAAVRRRLAWDGDADVTIDVAASDLLATLKAVTSTSTGDIEILCDKGLFGMRTPGATVITRVLAVEFPNLDPVMACEEHHCAVTLPTAVLTSMMKRALSMADDEPGKVELTAHDGALQVTTTESTGGISDSVEVDHQGEGHRLAVSSRRLHRALSAVNHQKVTLAFQPTGYKAHMVSIYPDVIEPVHGVLRQPDADTVATLIGIRSGK